MTEAGSYTNITKYTDVLLGVDGLDLLQRVLIAHDGTVQKLLAVMCKSDVHVFVEDQQETNGVINRCIHLYVTHNGKRRVLCTADSVIPVTKNENGFINGIRNMTWGIGQLLESIPLQSKRIIVKSWFNKSGFVRQYKLVGINWKLDVTITESFMDDVIKECIQ